MAHARSFSHFVFVIVMSFMVIWVCEAYIGEFVVEGFFFLKVVTFFATLTANYGPLLHLITGFNWLPTEIMAWGP